MILLDTCVVSETLRPYPDPLVLTWLDSLEEETVFLPSLVLGELRKGVELLPDGNKKAALSLWLVQLSERFASRTVGFDADAANRWGHLSARLQKAGITLPVIDGMLAALALVPGAVLATRNTADFHATGVTVWNPWQAGPE